MQDQRGPRLDPEGFCAANDVIVSGGPLPAKNPMASFISPMGSRLEGHDPTRAPLPSLGPWDRPH
jgi:hypothetical protein